MSRNPDLVKNQTTDGQVSVPSRSKPYQSKTFVKNYQQVVETKKPKSPAKQLFDDFNKNFIDECIMLLQTPKTGNKQLVSSNSAMQSSSKVNNPSIIDQKAERCKPFVRLWEDKPKQKSSFIDGLMVLDPESPLDGQSFHEEFVQKSDIKEEQIFKNLLSDIKSRNSNALVNSASTSKLQSANRSSNKSRLYAENLRRRYMQPTECSKITKTNIEDIKEL